MDFQLQPPPTSPRGDQPRAISELVSVLAAGEKDRGPARRHRLRQDLHHGQDHRGGPAPRPRPRTQQDPRRAALSRVQILLPAKRRRVLRLSTTTTTSLKPTSPPATSSSKRKPPSTRSSTKLRLSAHALPLRTPRLHHLVSSRLLHLRPPDPPEAYYGMLLLLESAASASSREDITEAPRRNPLSDRNDVDFRRGTFRVRGDIIEVFPTYDENAYQHRALRRRDRSLCPDRPALRHRSGSEILAPPHLPKVPLRRPARTQNAAAASIPSTA